MVKNKTLVQSISFSFPFFFCLWFDPTYSGQQLPDSMFTDSFMFFSEKKQVIVSMYKIVLNSI